MFQCVSSNVPDNLRTSFQFEKRDNFNMSIDGFGTCDSEMIDSTSEIANVVFMCEKILEQLIAQMQEVDTFMRRQCSNSSTDSSLLEQFL